MALHPFRKTACSDFYWRSHGCRHGDQCQHSHNIYDFRAPFSDPWVMWYREEWVRASQQWVDIPEVSADADPPCAAPEAEPDSYAGNEAEAKSDALPAVADAPEADPPRAAPGADAGPPRAAPEAETDSYADNEAETGGGAPPAAVAARAGGCTISALFEEWADALDS